MFSELLHSALANVWTAFLVILFFGGSIFVHELGHFLAARRRGLKIERFSIGFGPAIWSHHGKDGVEYRVAWFPLGGYVLLPQLADLSMIEGKSESVVAEAEDFASHTVGNATLRLPAVAYGSKMLVFVAGATFNVLFAFVLACILSVVGVPERNDTASTQIGYITPTLDLPDGTKVPSPASAAGLRIGDVIKAVDGVRVSNWADLTQTLEMSGGRDSAGHPRAVFDLVRGTQPMQIVVAPRLSGEDKFRRVGILPAFAILVYAVTPGSAADRTGFKPNDEIVSLDGVPILNNFTLGEYLEGHTAQPVIVRIKRGGAETALTIPPRPAVKPDTDFGLTFSAGSHLIHPSPFRQLWEQVTMTLHTLTSLLNPRSDIGLSNLSGPVGIVHIFSNAAEAGLRVVLMFTILVNINLAILNLLPIPVLDGGQMLFATIGRLRGRALPINFILTTQSVFMVLLFSMILYVSFFDVRRWARDVSSDKPPAAATAKP
jgi:regulator of sigma E protease